MEEQEVKAKKPTAKELIEQTVEIAVAKAIKAMYVESRKKADDYYKMTMHRLEALPVLIERVEDNKDRLAEMELEGALPQTSKSIVKFQADGVRADPMEMFDAVKQSLRAHIIMDTEEIQEVQKAMDYVSDDAYYETIKLRFMDRKSDYEVAEIFCCDETTIRRNRSRLVHLISVRLYGVPAVTGENSKCT